MQVSAQNNKAQYAYSQAGTSVSVINDEYILGTARYTHPGGITRWLLKWVLYKVMVVLIRLYNSY